MSPEIIEGTYMEDKIQKGSKKPWAERFLLLIIGLSIIFWACAFPLIKFSLNELSPENLAIIRLFIASLIFAFILIIKPKKFSKLHKKDIPIIFLLGFIGISGYHLSLNYGEQHVSAGAASLIITTIPIFVIILASIFLSEKITIKTLSGIALSFLGVIIISLWGNPGIIIEFTYLSGAAAVLIAALVGAIYTIAGKKLIRRYSALSLTTYAFIIGNTGLIIFIKPLFFEQIYSLSFEVWISVIFLAVFPTVASYTFWYAALEIITASKLTVYLYFIPVVSTLVSCLFFNEVITYWYLIGGLLVIFGLYIVNRKKSINFRKQSND